MENNKQLDLYQGRNEQKVKNNYKILEWTYILCVLALISALIFNLYNGSLL